jgi:prophage maintenance system killer protein
MPGLYSLWLLHYPVEPPCSASIQHLPLSYIAMNLTDQFSKTFLWLQGYDDGTLQQPDMPPGGILPSAATAMQAILQLKQVLIERGEATPLFANPRDDGLEGIFGNLEQTVFGEPAYPSIESKAAHLLYFVVKNHPFTDGNKRSGAFLFVDFLQRNQRLVNASGQLVINPSGLTALTLLVAESDPKQKEMLIRLIMHSLL